MKNLCESKELLMYRRLNSRLELNAEEANHYFNLEKGFEGEKKFEIWFKQNRGSGIILSDLQLIKSILCASRPKNSICLK
ncbi:hypothetical protein [Metabacillus idriensis]|uniref:hypothetical protein n=1 Tax=Metabacillus idriensis TaxID=324768 RepID=UPI00174D2F0A|nr:hypothetical protein [Metabacillus idriensis]